MQMKYMRSIGVQMVNESAVEAKTDVCVFGDTESAKELKRSN